MIFISIVMHLEPLLYLPILTLTVITRLTHHATLAEPLPDRNIPLRLKSTTLHLKLTAQIKYSGSSLLRASPTLVSFGPHLPPDPKPAPLHLSLSVLRNRVPRLCLEILRLRPPPRILPPTQSIQISPTFPFEGVLIVVRLRLLSRNECVSKDLRLMTPAARVKMAMMLPKIPSNCRAAPFSPLAASLVSFRYVYVVIDDTLSTR